MGVYVEPVVLDFWQLARDADGHFIDQWGPLDCNTHSTARLIMRHYEGQRPAGISGVWPPNGEWIRSVTRNPDGTLDRTGGTNLAQMDAVAKQHYAFDIDVRYGLAWEAFLNELAKTRGASLSVYYEPIRRSSFRGSYTFKTNHQIFVGGVDRARGVLTGVIDPLADGRLTSSGRVFRGPADYPISLLKNAAGQLNLATSGYRALGQGKCYVGFSRATGEAPASWRVSIAPGATIRIYTLGAGGCIQSWKDQAWGTNGSSAPCNAPVSRKTCSGSSSATTAYVTAGAFAGKHIRVGRYGVTAVRA
ncbi:MAG TPA: hypothetical protein VJP59_00165 [Gemmatimonadota bacterium]|nr:hypothetical protein [Gemmatimonadota bacterium]